VTLVVILAVTITLIALHKKPTPNTVLGVGAVTTVIAHQKARAIVIVKLKPVERVIVNLIPPNGVPVHESLSKLRLPATQAIVTPLLESQHPGDKAISLLQRHLNPLRLQLQWNRSLNRLRQQLLQLPQSLEKSPNL
jgi:hypothetical protein